MWNNQQKEPKSQTQESQQQAKTEDMMKVMCNPCGGTCPGSEDWFIRLQDMLIYQLLLAILIKVVIVFYVMRVPDRRDAVGERQWRCLLPILMLALPIIVVVLLVLS